MKYRKLTLTLLSFALLSVFVAVGLYNNDGLSQGYRLAVGAVIAMFVYSVYYALSSED